MGQQEYQAGANMAFKAFGIVDQMQQRQMMQQLQEQQMGQQALQMQLIQAQIKKAQSDAEEITKQRATMNIPYENWFTPEMKSTPAPLPGEGKGMFPLGATIEQPTGGRIFSPPQGATAGQVLQMSPLQEAFRAKEYKPSTEEAAIRLKQAGIQSQQGSADIQAYNLAKSQGYQGTLLDFYRAKQTPQKPISMGNAIEAAMNEKFGMDWMNNPEVSKQAHLWVGTEEGKKRVGEWAQRLIPPSYTFPVTSGGIVPAISRGPGAGTMGQPTGLGKPLTSEMVTFEGQYNQIKQGLQTVKDLYKKEYVGPTQAAIGTAREKVLGGLSENQAMFYAKMQEISNVIVYLYSGKQINENEYKRLMSSLPTRYLPDETFETRMKGFEQTLEAIREGRKAGMGGYGSSNPQPKINIPQPIQGKGWKATPVQ